jgi:hypothetical protein
MRIGLVRYLRIKSCDEFNGESEMMLEKSTSAAIKKDALSVFFYGSRCAFCLPYDVMKSYL